MNLLRSLGVLALLPVVACAATAEDEVDTSEGAASLGVFDADLAKNQARKVTTSGKGDFCVAVKRLPGASYRDDDEKKEDKLCNADFYADADQGDLKAVALCPKIVSTNPGVDVYEIPAGKTKASIQNDGACNALDQLDQLDKLGKFKQSVWCSHTGAILAAYHVSRALGDVAGVPAAVLRTMDKAEHREIADQGARLTAARYRPSAFIRRNWNALWPCLHDGKSCGLAGTPSENLFIQGPAIWDDDVKASNFTSGHVVGALMGNASEDGKYPNITTSASLKANKRYQALAGGALAFPKTFTQETVQGILAMKDIGDFLILDTIIEQQDRFSESGGNLSQKQYLTWRAADGTVQAERADKREKAPADALTVARMVIEDNDCGLRKGMRRARGYDDLIAQIRHLAPSTYRGLQNLAATIDGQREVFTQSMAMSNREFDRLVENVKFVASTFSEKCRSGKLTLDLDVATYVSGAAPEACQ